MIYELSCADFSRQLASKAPVPGGGGTAALMGSLAAALCAMAGNLTSGKKKFALYEDDLQRMIGDCEALRVRFLALIDADADAFAPLSRAYSLPKEDPANLQILQEATLNAARAPFAMMQCCCSCIALLEEMQEKCSRLMISDVGCGALAAAAALEAAAMNVFINTKSLPEQPEAQAMEKAADEMLDAYLPRARRIAATVSTALRR